MKEKISIIVLGIITVFIISGFNYGIANATSGACSSHGGVNCSLGPSYDGTVTCNDYSSGSTVRYWDMVECNGSITQILENCPATGDLLTQIKSSVNQFIDLQAKEAQALLDAENMLAPMSLIEGKQASIKSDYGKQLSSVYKDIKTKCQTASIQQMENWITTQQNSCPANASLVGSSCVCNDGYMANGSVCITYTQNCQNQYGINSYGDKNYCYCSAGYEMNSSKTACVLSSVCPENSTKIGNNCLCNTGYLMKDNVCITYTQSCQLKYGANSYGDKDYCYCNTGYGWNQNKTACIQIICPLNSALINNQCFCNDGYVLKNNKCITHTEDCIQSFGDNVYGVKGDNGNSSCYCSDGYEWTPSRTACIKTITCPLNSTKINNICVCDTGYKWDSSETNCIKEEIQTINQNIKSQDEKPSSSPFISPLSSISPSPSVSQNKEMSNVLNGTKEVQQKKFSPLKSFSNFLASISNAFTGFFSRIFK